MPVPTSAKAIQRPNRRERELLVDWEAEAKNFVVWDAYDRGVES